MTEPVFEITDTPAAAGQSSVLDRLKDKTLATLQSATKRLRVPERDGFEVAYSQYMPKEVWQAYLTAHEGDRDRYAKAVLVGQCRQILVDGETWLGSDRQPITFRSQEMWAALDVVDAFDAVKVLYLRDPDVWRAGDAVLRACGWDLREPLDPTKP